MLWALGGMISPYWHRHAGRNPQALGFTRHLSRIVLHISSVSMEGPMKASDQISRLAAHGRYHFSTREIAQIMGVSLTAVRAALRRLKHKGLIATPYRGFHVIVAPEYRGIGCLPADQFIGQLMEHLGLPYYVALLSAARYHGAGARRSRDLPAARHPAGGADTPGFPMGEFQGSSAFLSL